MNTGARMLMALALMGRDQAWLLRESRLGPNTIDGVLTGITRTPRPSTIETIVALLGVPKAWLFADTPQRQLTEIEYKELRQCVRTIRALARGLRADVRARSNVERETRLRVPHQLKLRGAREVYRVRGASMSGFGLMHGDLLYVKPLDSRFAVKAAVGAFVVFRLNDALYLKQFTVGTRGRIVLRSAHTGYDPMTIRPGEKLELLGRVVASVRELG